MQLKLIASVIKTLEPKDKAYEVFDATMPGFILRVQPSGVMTYYLRYRNANGERRRYRIGTTAQATPAQARDVVQQLSARVIGGEDVLETRAQARVQVEAERLETLGGFIEHKYGPWLEAERPEKRRSTEVLQRLQSNFSHLMDTPMPAIAPWTIERWRAEQVKAGKARSTINRDVTVLYSVLSKAVTWDVIRAHPLQKLKPLRIDKRGRVRFLSSEEEIRFRNALKERDARLKAGRERGNAWRRERGYTELTVLGSYADHLEPLVLLALNTGLRRSELFGLRWRDVYFQTETLTVQGETTKTRQTRHIDLSDEALAVLTTWCEQTPSDGYIFPSRNGERLDNVRKAWTALCRDADLHDFRFHDLRHAFASKLVMLGEDLNTVRELLGHTSMNMTLRYAHLAPSHKARAVKRLSPPAEIRRVSHG